jgi:hypothetical protein
VKVELHIGKQHVAIVSVVLLLASASATVEVRDTLQVHGLIDMNDNRITGLVNPSSPTDAANKRYVDNSGGGGFYGDGSDGEKVVSGTESASGIKYYEGLTVERGATLNVDGSRLVVFSTKPIKIRGNINAKGKGAGGGSGGSGFYSRDPASSGGNGIFGPGGDGGQDGDKADGAPGGSQAWDSRKINRLRRFGSKAYDDILTGGLNGGAGGGGGHAGDEQNTARYIHGRPNGGNGGDGGGIVVLVGPNVKVSGKVNVDGEDGGNGGGVQQSIRSQYGTAYDGTPSGGGGGGAGGLIALAGGKVEAPGDLSVEGGSGGVSPSYKDDFGADDAKNGTDGSPGRAFVLG